MTKQKMTTLDPALKKLLDELPAGSPDGEIPMAIAWITFCPNVVQVPLGVTTEVNFGKWGGPIVPATEVVIHVQAGGKQFRRFWNEKGLGMLVGPGTELLSTLTMRVDVLKPKR